MSSNRTATSALPPLPVAAPPSTAGTASRAAAATTTALPLAAALSACGGANDPTVVSGTEDFDSPAARSLRDGGQDLPPAGAALVAASGKAGGAAGPLGQPRAYAVPATDAEAARFLLHAQFSALEADIAAVRGLGYAGWLARQFEVTAVNTAWAWLNQKGYGANTFAYASYPSDFAVWWQLFNAPDALRKRMALALSEIFVISANSIPSVWPSFVVANWWDMLSSHAFGNFRTLLESVTLHPAMGFYLNTLGSQKEDATGRQPDENYARELMQLMTIGLVELQPDGTPVTANGAPVESYTQDDVTHLARVFSGYTLNLAANVPSVLVGTTMINSSTFTRLPMLLNAGLHSTRDVRFLGTDIPGSTAGDAARRIALDTLFNHANVGPFIGRQLIQRLVTSNPSPAYVGRVAAAFADNGRGVRGDLAATLAAILLDVEAREPAGLAGATFGHLREPVVRIVQWGRSFGLNSARGTWKFYDQSAASQLAQSPLRAPSVFNFFRPGYVPASTPLASAGLLAPEFQLVNEATVGSYVNTLQALLKNGLYVASADLPQIVNGPTGPTDGFDIKAAYAAELPLATDASALVARLSLVLAAGQLSADTRALMVSALEATPLTAASSGDARLNRVAGAVLMVMASCEYLVQK
ncbi:DUF1800 family protein [Xylophilus sp. Kf1]|nr:DUF1800 family protein [Xylophilus sp. Kf1]